MTERSDETTASVFDTLAAEYDAWYDGKGRLSFLIEVEALRDLSISLPRPWLEVGVGSGRFAQALGIDVGLDPAARLLDMAWGRGVDVLLGVGERPPFQDATFGALFLIVTLCFVDSPPEVLREANRLLKDDGKVILGLVLRESAWGKAYLARKEEGHRFYRHATFYSFEEVSALLRGAGFSIHDVVSTLFQEPGQVKDMELPRRGFYPHAGFVVVSAGKSR